MAMSKTSVEIQKVLTAWDSLSKDQIKELITIQLTALTNLEDSLDLADPLLPDIPSSISQESFLSEITSSKDDEVNYFFITIRHWYLEKI